jgi:hypothetical protein
MQKKPGLTSTQHAGKDGRFLLKALVEGEVSSPMTVVLNWAQMVKKK